MGEKEKKNILIVTYYWPPAGGPGVQRWLNFVKNLPVFNYNPIVFTTKFPEYPIKDRSMVDEIPKNVEVIRNTIIEPHKVMKLFFRRKTKIISSGILDLEKMNILDKFFLWIRGNFFIPDSRVTWIKPSIKKIKRCIEKYEIDTIITTGPPHSIHLIGLQIKEDLKLRWIADFRDPWTTIIYHDKLRLTNRSKRKHIILERKVLHKADEIIVTSPSTKVEFEEKTNKKVYLITNGFERFKRTKLNLSKDFTFSHIGTLLTERNPEILWQVFSEMLEEERGFKDCFCLQLAGRISQQVIDSIEAYGLVPYTHILNYLPHDVAIGLQESSHVLLLIEIDSDNTRAIVPGKLFEYMVAKAPIIAIGPKGWDVEPMIKHTETGRCFDYSQKEALKDEVKRLYENFKKGINDKSPKNLDKYSRIKLTEDLAKILNHN